MSEEILLYAASAVSRNPIKEEESSPKPLFLIDYSLEFLSTRSSFALGYPSAGPALHPEGTISKLLLT